MGETKTWLDIEITRGPIVGPLKASVGLIVNVKADPAVEDFMKVLSAGKKTNVELLGNQWAPLKDKALEVYSVPRGTNNALQNYTIEHPGRSLLLDLRGLGVANPHQMNANLSFLRLVGISEGVSFGIVGAYSNDFIAALNRIVLAEAKQFFLDFITPVNVNLKIYSKD